MEKHPFRTNWWHHYCPVLQEDVWKHKQYLHCDKCGEINGRAYITRKTI